MRNFLVQKSKTTPIINNQGFLFQLWNGLEWKTNACIMQKSKDKGDTIWCDEIQGKFWNQTKMEMKPKFWWAACDMITHDAVPWSCVIMRMIVDQCYPTLLRGRRNVSLPFTATKNWSCPTITTTKDNRSWSLKKEGSKDHISGRSVNWCQLPFLFVKEDEETGNPTIPKISWCSCQLVLVEIRDCPWLQINTSTCSPPLSVILLMNFWCSKPFLFNHHTALVLNRLGQMYFSKVFNSGTVRPQLGWEIRRGKIERSRSSGGYIFKGPF